MTDICEPVEVDEHNVSDPSCDYAPGSGAPVLLSDIEQILAAWWDSTDGHHKDLTLDGLTEAVERIVADRLAAERERIAQAIQAYRNSGDWPADSPFDTLTEAARIARGTAQ